MFSMLLLSDIDPNLLRVVIISFAIISVGLVFKLIKQPYIIAYILVGVLLGQHGLAWVTDGQLTSNLGDMGLILLLFFIGMEISLPQLIANWKVPVIGTLIQVVFSVLAVGLVGYFMDWKINRIIMLGFVISLSSTAVVVRYLQDRKELATRPGRNALSVLLAQDIIVVPMLIVLSYLTGTKPEFGDVALQLAGGALLCGIVVYIVYKKHISLPFESMFSKDHELQVFLAIVLCFGFSILSAFFGLSAALGAFVAGIVVSSAKATEWVHESLNSFRVVFVALFFVSIGMLIDFDFVRENWGTVAVFIVMVLAVNTLINAGVMRIFGVPFKESLYTGAVLAQIGEFSFILGSTGYAIGVISEYAYQLDLAIISGTLLLSPGWTALNRRIFMKGNPELANP